MNFNEEHSLVVRANHIPILRQMFGKLQEFTSGGISLTENSCF